MHGFKPDRAHYIRPEMIERQDSESSAVVYTYESAANPCALYFSGKRQRPDDHRRYRSEERREAAITEHFENVRRRERFHAEQAEQRKAVTRANSSLDFADQTYLSPAAVGALCRQSLKEAFPGVRFSVTSDGSLRVRWTDGPSREQVECVAKTFAGSYFDGMIDYKGSIYHTLDGRNVRLGADFVFCEREMSVEALQLAAEALAREYQTNQPAATITATSWSPKVDVNPDFPGAVPGQWAGEFNLMPPAAFPGRCGVSERAPRALELWFDHLQPFTVQESATLARLAVRGSDGYGNTALEAADGGPTGRGYPQPKEPPEAAAAREALDKARRDLVRELEEPTPVACEVIDFAPHLAAHVARADAARRIN